MWEDQQRSITTILKTVVVVALASCGGSGTGERPPLTDVERAAIADTIHRLVRDQNFDTSDCEDIVAWIPSDFLTVADGQIVEVPLQSHDQAVASCRAFRQTRLSAHDEIQEERVHVLSRDAAYVVTRSVYTVRWNDGRTTVRPQVTTIVWARRADGWRRVHLHESWRSAAQPPSAAPDSSDLR